VQNDLKGSALRMEVYMFISTYVNGISYVIL